MVQRGVASGVVDRARAAHTGHASARSLLPILVYLLPMVVAAAVLPGCGAPPEVGEPPGPSEPALTFAGSGGREPMSGARIRLAQALGSAGLAEARLPPGSLQVVVGHEYREAIVASSIRRAAFTLEAPEGARLRLSMALTGGTVVESAPPRSADDSPKGALRVGKGGMTPGAGAAGGESGWELVVSGGPRGGTRALLEERLMEGDPDGGRWTERSVDLSAWSGQEIQIVLEARPIGAPVSLALWGSPVIEATRTGATPATRPNILLVSLDTMRADRVGRVVKGHPLTPELDRLAAEGALFTGCRSQAPSTLFGHGAMLTGLLPAAHGASTKSVLPAGVPYLPETLARAGYATVALTDDGLLDGRYGFARGFDRFRSVSEAIEAKTDLALETLDELGGLDGPWFMLFHTYTIHVPYAPPPEFASLFTDPYEGPLGAEIDARHIKKTVSWMNQGRIPVRDEDLKRLEALYDGEVRRADAALGRIFARLRELGRWDDTIVVVTSDHGEEFNEHGIVAWHALTCHEELMRVPLVIKPATAGSGGVSADRAGRGDDVPGPAAFAGGLQIGRRIDTAVRTIDIAPTLLELAGVGGSGAMSGRSLAGLMAGRSEPDRDTICEVDDARGAAILIDGWKYHMRAKWSVEDPRTLRRRLDERGPYPAEALYRLASDPWEQVDLLGQRPDRAARMRALLQGRLREATDLLAELTADDPAARIPLEDPEHIERLRALGYVD